MNCIKDTFYQGVKKLAISNIKKICEIFPIFKLIETGRIKLIYEIARKRKKHPISTGNLTNIEIEIFVDNDEWYYLDIKYKIKSPFDGASSWHVEQFKCDQWDGLLECIKKEIIEKYK